MRPKLNVRAIVLIFAALSLFFVAEFALDFFAARTAGRPTDLQESAAWSRAYLGNLSRAFNVLSQLVITAIALAVPLTSTIYTPKFIDVFLRDRVNQFVLGYFMLGMANAIFVGYATRDGFEPSAAIALLEVQFTVGIAILIPYYYYMFRAIDPSSITVVLAERAEGDLVALARRGAPGAADKDRIRERLHHLGNIVLRSLERSDRDVALEAIGAIHRVLRRYALLKRRFPPDFFVPERRHFPGISDAGFASVERDRAWVERTALHQLELAFAAALAKVPDVISEIAATLEMIAAEASAAGDEPLLRLAIRYFNSFTREALKKRDLHAIHDIFFHYAHLAKELVDPRPATACAIARYFRYYAELARATGTPFVCELVGHDLARVVEAAYATGTPPREQILETFLSIDAGGAGRASLRLAKAKVLLAAFFRGQNMEAEAERVLASCGPLGPDLVRQIERDFAEAAAEPEFWEVTDRQENFDHVPPDRAPLVGAILDGLRAPLDGGARAP